MAKSFLLALDGSQEALFAADVAAALAKSKGARLTAQTVVDSQSVWEIVGRRLPCAASSCAECHAALEP